MDNNVPPYNTLLVVDALIKANKDFDLLMLPNAAHGYGAASQLHDAAALGLLREVAARRRSRRRSIRCGNPAAAAADLRRLASQSA